MKKILLSNILILLSVVSFGGTELKTSCQKSSNDSLIHFFRTLDKSILQSGNDKLIIPYLTEKNNDMFKFMIDRYPQFGPYDMVDVQDETATWVALFYAMSEAVDFRVPLNSGQQFQGRTPQWVICVLDIIGAATGISDIISQLSTLSAGSVWSTIKTIVKKYLRGWVTVTFALIRIMDDCF